MNKVFVRSLLLMLCCCSFLFVFLLTGHCSIGLLLFAAVSTPDPSCLSFSHTGCITREGCKVGKMAACSFLWKLCPSGVLTCCQPEHSCRRYLEAPIERAHLVKRNRIRDLPKEAIWLLFGRVGVLHWVGGLFAVDIFGLSKAGRLEQLS